MRVRPYRESDRDAILAMRAKQESGWFGKTGSLEGFDPENPQTEFVYVLEENGAIIAAVGAKRTVELRMVMSPDGRDLASFFRHDLMPLWAKTVAELYRRGYGDCFAYVPIVIKKWANTLVRRAGFKRERDFVLTFDVNSAVRSLDGSH